MTDRRHRRRRRADHPAWRFAQVTVMSAALAFFAAHVASGGHADTVASGHLLDPSDGSGALGLAIAGKLAYQLLGKLGGQS